MIRVFTIIIHYLHLFGRSLGNTTKGFLQHGEFPQCLKQPALESFSAPPPIHHSDSPRCMVKCEFHPLITVKSTTQFSPGALGILLCLPVLPLESHLVSESACVQEHSLHQHPQHVVLTFPESHGQPCHSLQRFGLLQRTWQVCCD